MSNSNNLQLLNENQGMYFQRIINGTEQTFIYSTEDQAQRLMQATEVFK